MHAKMLYAPQERVHETIIELLIIFNHCQTVSMATARFRPPKTEEEEISLLSETVPKYTTYNTKWAVNVFTAWRKLYENEQKSAVGNSWTQRT